MTERRFVTPAEAASVLRVSTDTVLRLISAGTLPAIRVSPRLIRIPAPAFEAYQRGKDAEPAPRGDASNGRLPSSPRLTKSD
jgi:excisionase family DNA binding protein